MTVICLSGNPVW